MSRLRLVFISSVIILVAVSVATFFFIPPSQGLTESKRVHIIEGEEEWILQCDLINRQEKAISYGIHVTVDDAIYRDSTVVLPGKTYTYIHHIYPQQLDKGEVIFTLYQDNSTQPVEQATYYLKPD
ncbi:MAG: hypothetical protein JSW16_03850 [Dehalococcoidales bacterium]|nr:MAG: hypothetical protein JSW16_03850 [Dehalococcoidales bacterium]